MRVLTSITQFKTGEGMRVSYTFSEVDENTGKIVSQNNRENFIATDAEFVEKLSEVEDYIKRTKLEG